MKDNYRGFDLHGRISIYTRYLKLLLETKYSQYDRTQVLDIDEVVLGGVHQTVYIRNTCK